MNTMANPIIHKHHIIPRHLGGMDFYWNIAELSVSEHADAHRRLFEWQKEYGFEGRGDFMAWKMLSGVSIEDPDIVRVRASLGGKKAISNMTKEQRSKGGKISIEKIPREKKVLSGKKMGPSLQRRFRERVGEEEYKRIKKEIGKKAIKTLQNKSTKEQRKEWASSAGKVSQKKRSLEQGKEWSSKGGKNRMSKLSKEERSAFAKMGGSSTKGMVWYNNGIKSKRCFEGKQPEGFIKGILVRGRL